MRNKKSDIVWLAYHQGKIFQKFKLKERFVNDMVSKFKVSKSTIVFKIALSKLIDEYPKIKDSSLPLHYFKEHLKSIKSVKKTLGNLNNKSFFKFTSVFSTVLFYFVWGSNCAVFANKFLSLVTPLKLVLSNVCGSIWN